MATKQTPLSEGDTVSVEGEITRIGDDGTVSLWLHGYATPITIRAERVNLVAKHYAENPKRNKPN